MYRQNNLALSLPAYTYALLDRNIKLTVIPIVMINDL